MKSFENEIKAHSLKNALEYGSTNPGKILPKLFIHGLKKEDIKKIMPDIISQIKTINSLSKAEQRALFKRYEQYLPEKEEERKELQELPNISKKMAFRIAPFPSGALHLGHAKMFLINSLYAKKYNAKLLLVIDDTIGSEKKQITPESYKLIENAFKFLKIKYAHPIIYKSDRLEIYYKYAKKLIEKNKAYICYCSQSNFKILKDNKKNCPCRNLPGQLEKWSNIFKAKPGSQVLRLKTSMQDKNPAFRDRVLFKISDRSHPRVKQKYRIWPTLEMSWAIDDHLLGITHIIRGNELLIETEVEKFIWDIFRWKHTETIHTGLVNIEGDVKLSKSKAQKEVASGKYTGWDDPRTWSIQSLERRGIKAESIIEFVKSIGLNKQNITLPIESLYKLNRKIIDQISPRFSFIQNPIELKIKNSPKIKYINLKIHPDKPKTRKVKINKIYISKKDFQKNRDREIRLLHLYNIKLNKTKPEAEFTSKEIKSIPKLSWVSDHIPCTILEINGEKTKGITGIAIKTLKYNETVQFERYGFAKLDSKKGNKYKFWYAHK